MFSKILAAVDLSEEEMTTRVLDASMELAGKHGATLDVLTVVPTYGMSIVGSYFPRDYEESALNGARAMLKERLEAADAPGATKGHVAHGKIYEEIMKAAKRLECDLIVMGSHGPELKDYLLGPNAARVVRHASQSVFVLR